MRLQTGRNMGVSCHVANADEFNAIKKFLIEHFWPNVAVDRSLGIHPSSKEVEKCMDNALSECFSKQTTIVATNENGELVGVSVNHLIEDQPDFQEEDITALIPNGLSPFNNLEALLNKLQKGFRTIIPKECRKVLLISMLSVRKEYSKTGIGRELLQTSTENAKKNGFDAAIALSVSKASQIVFRKLEYSVLRVLKYEDFMNENGCRLIQCDDGTEEGQLVFLKL